LPALPSRGIQGADSVRRALSASLFLVLILGLLPHSFGASETVYVTMYCGNNVVTNELVTLHFYETTLYARTNSTGAVAFHIPLILPSFTVKIYYDNGFTMKQKTSGPVFNPFYASFNGSPFCS
jgi:hypothetical protein